MGSRGKSLCIYVLCSHHCLLSVFRICMEVIFVQGQNLHQTKEGLYLSQIKYLMEILRKFGMEYYKPICMPMEISYNLSQDDKSLKVNQSKYGSMIKILLYLTTIRPNIMHVVGIMGQFKYNPKETHLKVSL